ncbi:30S ribosomal protein S17 [bacterium]|jgi:small subunit ribosomal protein S17|nr:30S ribosomal protein S17 [bacterium]
MTNKNVEKKIKRIFSGEVVSDKMDKTVVVKVVRTFKHPVVHKYVRRNKNYKVHDEQNEAIVGDVVEFCETRPISKSKNMGLIRIVRSRGKK